MQILKNNKSVTSQNLSNTNVPGFKKDIHASKIQAVIRIASVINAASLALNTISN